MKRFLVAFWARAVAIRLWKFDLLTFTGLTAIVAAIVLDYLTPAENIFDEMERDARVIVLAALGILLLAVRGSIWLRPHVRALYLALDAAVRERSMPTSK